MKTDHAIAQIERELAYTNFFRSFLFFLTQTIESLLTYESLPIETNNQLEQDLMTSISSLRNMHVSIFTKKTLYSKVLNNQSMSQPFDDDQAREIWPLLQQLKTEIEHCTFLNEDYKSQCRNTLDQILHYYLLNSATSPIMIESNLHAPPPWLSKSFSIRRCELLS
ncbi:hypothetical protein PB01_16890 [Psychrobacillus glaciei]|uniref:Uncharacterized protein n=1 Tax=Psychrobacillus glaciei TaxID=2283160 RepID=A0A5J6SQW1_9BACI|nr:hypothetical protein [Psychrobacillus glaciei]QFG00352.1 hypothetical protein PB01_16890 [Psychrobacillus glaciei]